VAGVSGSIDLGPAASPDLRWVADVLWGGLEGVQVRLGDPPPGATVLADLRVVPSASKPRLLVPADGAASRAALTSGGAVRGWRARVARASSGTLLRGPLWRAAFRDRLVVVDIGGGARTLGDALAEMLGETVLLAVNVRPPSPTRKPVVQVLDVRGRTLAYAKVAWHAFSDRNVHAETTFLGSITGADLGLAAPTPIGELTWGGHPVLVTAPMPASLRRYPASRGVPDVDLTRGIASLFGTTTTPWRSSRAREGLRGRAAELAADDRPTVDPSMELLPARGRMLQPGAWPALRPVSQEVLRLLELMDRSAEVPVETGAWHGDWSPWNLGLQGERLWAWDWEFARRDVLVGMDLVHFPFQQAFIARRRGFAASLAEARAEAAPSLAALGIDPPARDLVCAAHASEVALRYLASARAGVAAPPRFVDEAPAALRAESDRLGR